MKFTRLLMTAAMILPLATTPALARMQDQPKLSDFPKAAPVAPHLSEASKQLIRETFEKGHAEDKLLFEAMGHLTGEIHALMGASGYDHDVFVKKHQELANLRALADARRTDRMAFILDKLSPEERRLFTEHMRPMFAPMPGMMGGHGPMIQGQVPPAAMPCAPNRAPDGKPAKGMRHQNRHHPNAARPTPNTPVPVAPTSKDHAPMEQEGD